MLHISHTIYRGKTNDEGQYMVKLLATKYSQQHIMDVKKSLQFKNTSYVWNTYHFNQSRYVGKCSLIAQEYLKQAEAYTLDDYEQFYFSQIDYEQYYQNSKRFKEKLNESGIQITYDNAFFYQFIRVIFDSFIGIVLKEQNILNYLQDDTNYVEHADEETDRKYCIDLIILNATGLYEGVQVKPISFLNGVKSKKPDILKDFETCISGQDKWLNKNGNEKIYWLFYKDGEIIEKDFNEIKELYYDCTN